eukprot:Phypoly_transcript_03032.p1 GENE.Phypoly_transcript_03032~~Phypoly_transcript_03032.p1  ORF type:complete len:830 (+),score=97.20 Phypoly_transcript_03032:47-2536(+)
MVHKVRVVSKFAGIQHQGHLAYVVQDLFDGKNILHNIRKEAGIKSQAEEFYEIDIWIPEVNLYFEYQEGHHYTTTWYSNIAPEVRKESDYVKSATIALAGGTLIVVPCWWDGSIESLAATIQFQRPDLFQTPNAIPQDPIILNPECEHFEESTRGVPGIGELMIASFPERSNTKFKIAVSPSRSWWMGEKYDGIRFCWHSAESALYTRSGAELNFPANITRELPREFTEGEVWFGRGTFTHSQTLLNADPHGKTWEYLRFLVFDNPSPLTRNHPFENRYASLCAIPPDSSLAILVARILCTDSEFLADQVQNIIDEGGEGIILRKAESPYVKGISPYLLKIKAARGDSEALVVSTEAANYLLKLPDGQTFEIEKKKVETERKLKKGDIVSFFYDNFTRAMLPVNPVVYRIRTDLEWKEVVSDFLRKNPQKKELNVHSSLPLGKSTQANSKLRNFFLNLAKKRNFDPLTADNWYTFDIKTLKAKHRKTSVRFVNFVKGLKRAFPELNIQERKFKKVPRNYYVDTKNRRHFFDTFARSKGLNPLVPSTWYSITQDMILQEKGGQAVLAYMGGYCKAVMHLYPDIGLDRNKFQQYPNSYWLDATNRRKFFVEFAKQNGFDPLVAEHWYAFSKMDVLQSKRANSVLRYHKSLPDALITLFPNIGLDVHKFKNFSTNFLADKNNARNVFIRFANKTGFDPLVATNWYSVTREQVLSSQKGSRGVLDRYASNLRSALSDLFPDIGLDWNIGNLYGHVPRNHWLDASNQKAFFDNYAAIQGFDPLVAKNWSSENLSNLWNFKGVLSIANLYNKNLHNALLRAYPNIGLERFLKFTS